MTQLKVTVTVEDDFGVLFKETVRIPFEELIVPGTATAGMKTVAEALLKSAQEA